MMDASCCWSAFLRLDWRPPWSRRLHYKICPFACRTTMASRWAQGNFSQELQNCMRAKKGRMLAGWGSRWPQESQPSGGRQQRSACKRWIQIEIWPPFSSTRSNLKLIHLLLFSLLAKLEHHSSIPFLSFIPFHSMEELASLWACLKICFALCRQSVELQPIGLDRPAESPFKNWTTAASANERQAEFSFAEPGYNAVDLALLSDEITGPTTLINFQHTRARSR